LRGGYGAALRGLVASARRFAPSLRLREVSLRRKLHNSRACGAVAATTTDRMSKECQRSTQQTRPFEGVSKRALSGPPDKPSKRKECQHIV